MVSVFRHTLLVIACLCALGLSPAPARGQAIAAAEDDPLLQALIDEALARNPDLHAAQSAIAAAQTATERARALPDPMVSVTYTNDGWAPSLGSMPMTTLGFMVSQALPYSGKRDLRASLPPARRASTSRRSRGPGSPSRAPCGARTMACCWPANSRR